VAAHLPISTRARFRSRVANIRLYFALEGVDPSGAEFDWRNTVNPIAWHWRRWAALAGRGETDAEFDRNLFDRQQIDILRSEGAIRSAAELLGRGLIGVEG
jgi:hypothetical protein